MVRPLDIGKKMSLFTGNSRIGNDKNVDRRTCFDAELVDYLVFIASLPLIDQIILSRWNKPNSMDVHSEVSFNIYEEQRRANYKRKIY